MKYIDTDVLADEYYANRQAEQEELLEDEDNQKECPECQEKMIDKDEKFCNHCKKYLQEKFIKVMRENFDKEEIEYIDEYIEGSYLVDILYKEDKHE